MNPKNNDMRGGPVLPRDFESFDDVPEGALVNESDEAGDEEFFDAAPYGSAPAKPRYSGYGGGESADGELPVYTGRPAASSKFDSFDSFGSFESEREPRYGHSPIDSYAEDSYREDSYGGESPRAPRFSGYDDETPLTSEPGGDEGYADAAASRRSPGRREAIQRVAKEHADMKQNRPGGPGGRRKAGRPGTRLPRDREVTKVSMDAILGSQKRRKNAFSAFYSVLALLGVGAFLTVMIVLAQEFVSSDRNFAQTPTPTPAPYGTPPPAAAGNELSQLTGLVEDRRVFGQSNMLSIVDVNTRRRQEFTVIDTATITSRFGSPMTIDDVGLGHIITVAHRGTEIHSIREAEDAWIWTSRTNVHVDSSEGTISFGNRTYGFNNQTLALHQGRPFNIPQIRPNDSVTIAGFGNTAWFVRLESGHGFLRVVNADMVAPGSRLTIGAIGRVELLHSITEPLTLPEGTHRIIVEGDNIETFIHDVAIEHGRTATLNMAEVQFRMARLAVIVSPLDAEVFINGRPHDVSEPAELDFGEHTIRVESPGFVPQEETIAIANASTTIRFELEEIVVNGALRVTTVPSNAEVFVDSVFVGYSPITVEVSPGERLLSIRLRGHVEIVNAPVIVPSRLPGDPPVDRSYMLIPSTQHPADVAPSEPVQPLPTPAPVPMPMPQPVPTPQPAPAPQPAPLPPPGSGPALPTLPDEDDPFNRD